MRVAYFSAEYGLEEKLPIYAGGLGMLAGDILKEANDSHLPFVGIGLLYHDGFFRQRIDEQGNQIREDADLDSNAAGLERVNDPQTGRPLRIKIEFPRETVEIGIWKKMVGKVPLYLLDANLVENKAWERDYTAQLYEGDWAPHIAQEIILGVGGVRLLRRLGITVDRYHLNDDHSAFGLLERLREQLASGKEYPAALQAVKEQTVYTTHTPVSGAESRFSGEFIWPYLSLFFSGLPVTRETILNLGGLDIPGQDQFSLTILALRMARKRNAVSRRHGQVAKKIWHFVFPSKTLLEVPIDYITNAVHVPTWVAGPVDSFYKHYLGKNYLRRVDEVDLWGELSTRSDELVLDLWQARLECKEKFVDWLYRSTGQSVSPQPLFFGFARRFAAYKRVYLLVSDMDRLARVLTNPEFPAFLFVAGKAHPDDKKGQGYLKQIYQASQDPRLNGHLILLEDYDLSLAKKLVAGVDVWLNTPKPPMEASGTSGMKTIFNGVLNASVADGWWYEAGNDEVGWVIGSTDPDISQLPSDKQTAKMLFDVLENKVVPLYYRRENQIPEDWVKKIIKSLLVLAPKFNTRRLIKEYQEKLYQ